ncbi:lipopolysaccharide biosynthesis protein [Bacillus sp. FJAT-27445]|uniref:lipopolysaccharide biosynthesis protein n=1 Tax=Bacillus sp. FJAT-27445 TaxID=1679166 RepID=UPI000743FA90|nr:oligosaccharide flippase family protein [Bacillus sp. FJAT-27445]
MKLLVNMKNTFIDNPFMKSISILAAGTAISHLFIFLTTPILTHLYSPEQFGIFSIYLSLLYSISVIASLMYDQAIPLPKDDQEGWDALVLSLMIAVGISIIVFVCALILPIGKWVGAPELDRYAWLLAISVFGIGWFQAFNSWSIRVRDFTSISRSKINMNSGQMVSQITFGFFHAGIFGLLAGEVIGRISGFLTFLKYLFKNKPKVKLFCFQGIKRAIIRYKNFPLISSWSAFINISGARIPAIFLAAHYGPAVAGWYLLAEKILTVPEALLGYSVKQVYMSESSRLHAKGEEFSSLFWMTVKKMSIIGGVVIGMIALAVPPFIPLLFGHEWKEAGPYLHMISLLFFMRMVVNPIATNFYVLESQALQIISEVIRFSLICLSMIVSYFYIERADMAILVISLLSSLGYLSYGIASWYIVKIHFRKAETSVSVERIKS